MYDQKACSKCRVEKPSKDFYKDKRLKSGLQSQCKACSLVVKKKKYQENPELKKAKSQQYRTEHPDYCKDYYAANQDRYLAFSRVFRQEHPDKAKADNEKFKRDNPEYFQEYRDTHKEETAARTKKWTQENPARKAASTAKRRAALLQRTPPWLTDEHWARIQEIYDSCPPGHHVDHIIPLQGETMSGLHVPWNLQHLTSEDNLSKSNKLEGHYGTEEETHI